jgi:hypothetical protein
VVRATYAEVVKKFGGSDPPGWDSTSIGSLCTQVDAEIDGRASPSTFGTGTNHVEFANTLVYREIMHSQWVRGGAKPPEPVVWNTQIREWFEALLTDTTYDAITTIKMQDTS